MTWVVVVVVVVVVAKDSGAQLEPAIPANKQVDEQNEGHERL